MWVRPWSMPDLLFTVRVWMIRTAAATEGRYSESAKIDCQCDLDSRHRLLMFRNLLLQQMHSLEKRNRVVCRITATLAPRVLIALPQLVCWPFMAVGGLPSSRIRTSTFKLFKDSVE